MEKPTETKEEKAKMKVVLVYYIWEYQGDIQTKILHFVSALGLLHFKFCRHYPKFELSYGDIF